MIGLIDTAVVYTPDPTSGDFTVVDNPSLPCRLAIVTVTGTDTGPGRVELVQERRLLWGPNYIMPAAARIVVNNEAWTIEAGSYADVRGPSGAVHYRRARIVRAV
jgi:hypothetical protein